MEKENKKKERVLPIEMLLAAIVVIGFIFARHYWATNEKENEVVIAGNTGRIAMERMLRKSVFFHHVIILMKKNQKLTNQERAQLLADSIPAAESEEMAADWVKNGFTASGQSMMFSIYCDYSQIPPSNSGQPFDYFINAEDYEFIFYRWEKIQPDNAFLKILFKPEKPEK